MDVLPIQATSVPCERIFSAAGDIVTKDRTRLLPKHVEMLQVFKFFLKKKRISFVPDWKMDIQQDYLDTIAPQVEHAIEENQYAELFDLLDILE
jgi:hypothetical protein